MNFETIETSKDGKARLLKATKDGSEWLYIETTNSGRPMQLDKSSQEIYGQDQFPKEHIQKLCDGFKEAGYPISEEWQRKWNLGALLHIRNKEKQ
ncbi:MAG: hypothetical protein Q7T53_13240 [Deltaproteobacteria bacterium]|nr:hypothetical protein [Deltaproteobacteria bacterium]